LRSKPLPLHAAALECAAMAKIKRVGVLGCGLMGSGIAQVSAQAGYDTVVVEVEQKFLDKGLAGIDKSLGKFVEKGKLSADDKSKSMSRLRGSVSLKDLAECDIVIEAITENPKIKKETYTAIDSIVKKDAIFASNTSSLTITELSMATARPKQFVGLHFFNPVPLMKLVEVVRTILTSDDTFNTAFEFAKSVGKDPVSCRDNSGFIVNRLLVPYLLDAIRAFEEGVGSIEDIDKAMQLGCGYPMGPFTLLDFVGLDTTYYITDVMFNEYREKRFASPALLRKMVLAGRFGRKSGAGFYDYSGDKPVPFI
jgi:3-hydroxybutyryl-CoA dehydrogenase